MEPNIRNFSQIEKFIKENPGRADSQAFEWRQFLKTNIESSPELSSIETPEEFYGWAREHPEKNINTSVWIGKEISEAYYYLREQHEDSQMKNEGTVDQAKIPHELAAAPFMAAAFLQKPKIMEDDGKYLKIEEKLKKEWLEKNQGKDFSSKEGIDHLYGSLDDSGKSSIQKEAEKTFRENPKYAKKVEKYDKEAKKAYKKQGDDPKWQMHKRKMLEEIRARQNLAEKDRDKKIKLSKEEIEKSRKEISMRVEKKYKERFAQENPEKARAYSGKAGAESRRGEGIIPGYQGGSSLTTNIPATTGGREGPLSSPHPSGGRLNRGINAINRIAGGGLKNPFGKIGSRMALQAISRGFAAFLFANPWVWAIFAIILIFFLTFFLVGGIGGGIPSILDGNPCSNETSCGACVERSDCGWTRDALGETCVSTEGRTEPQNCPSSASNATWFYGQCETDACDRAPDIIWDSGCTGVLPLCSSSIKAMFNESCEIGGTLTGDECCPLKVPGSVCQDVGPQLCSATSQQMGIKCVIPPVEP